MPTKALYQGNSVFCVSQVEDGESTKCDNSHGSWMAFVIPKERSDEAKINKANVITNASGRIFCLLMSCIKGRELY